jgi:hypothetical protein
MGGGFIGGDSSIQWDFQADKVKSHNSTAPGPGKRRQLAQDETNAGDPFFHVTIRLPVDQHQKDDFLKSLAEGLKAGYDGKPVSFDLRIEDKTNNGPISNQIQIFWTSEGFVAPGPEPEGQSAGTRGAMVTRSKRASKRRSTTVRRSKKSPGRRAKRR